MGTRFVVGMAALLVGLGAAGQAQAADQCNDLRNQARQSDDISKLRDLRIRANGCLPAVIQDIEARITAVTGEASLNPPPNVTPPRPPNPGAPPTVSRRPTPLTIGQTANGALTPSSAVDPESGSPYEVWSFRANAGQRLEISLQASGGSGLDTFLVLGRMRNGQFEEIDRNDDSGGGLNSMLRFAPDANGEYLIRARSFSAQGYGAYEVAVRPFVERPPAMPRPLTIGQRVTGNLGPDSSRGDDDIPYDLWTFQAQAGQRLAISMSAAQGFNLDTFVVLGRMRGGQFEEIDQNDDGGDGTLNSMLRFTPQESGEYVIRARSFSQGAEGSYDLVVNAPRMTVVAPLQIERRANAWMRDGQLSSQDGDDHVDFEFQAARAGRYSVQVFSGDFSAVVDVGLLGSDRRLTEIDFFNATANAASGDRTANAAQFTAERGKRYILRVSAATAASGRFDLVISPAP